MTELPLRPAQCVDYSMPNVTIEVPALCEGARARNHQCRPCGADGRNQDSVEVDLFSGRSLDAKKALYRAIVTNLGRLGIPAEGFKVDV